MPTETGASDHQPFWHAHLLARDEAAHAAAAASADERELAGLRLRTAELSAALTQARAAIRTRHELLADLSAALEERDAQIAELRRSWGAVPGTRRWRLVAGVRHLIGPVRRLTRTGFRR